MLPTLLFALSFGCSSDHGYIVDGIIVEVGPDYVEIDHQPIAGLAPAGIDRFGLRDPALLAVDDGVDRGDVVYAKLHVDSQGPYFTKFNVRGKGLVADKPKEYAVTGRVVSVERARVVVDHDEIAGLMPAMTMGFEVADDAFLVGLQPGDRVAGTMVVKGTDHVFVGLTRLAEGALAVRTDVPALQSGEVLPAAALVLEDGRPGSVGAGDSQRTALAFVYTRCPDPEMCPAIAARLAPLQDLIEGKARILTVTLDPENDSPEVLAAWGAQVGAKASTWRLGRAEPPVLEVLAQQAALTVLRENGRVVHAARLLVLDADGRLIERYDDVKWPIERVAGQLLTGEPRAPAGSDGTLSP